MRTFIVIFLLLILNSCDKKQLDYGHYLSWYESGDNPLKKMQVMGDIEFGCTLLTPDYFRARDMASGETNEVKDQDSSEYFKMDIRIKDHSVEPLHFKVSSEQESFERLNYFVSSIKDDVNLVVGLDTFSCLLHHYERVYHAGNAIRLLFVFDHLKEKGNRKIVLDDKVFGSGKILFNFSETDINSIPILKD